MFNLFVVLIFTFIIALILIYFIAAHDRKRAEKAQLEQINEDKDLLNFRQFTKICMDICENLKLEVEDVIQASDDEVIIKAVSLDPITKVQFLIVGIHTLPKSAVDNNRIMEISDQIVSERISKGLILTTGMVDPSIKKYPELAPIEFIDGLKLKSLIAEYKINF